MLLIGPVFRAGDLLNLFRNAVIPSMTSSRARSPPRTGQSSSPYKGGGGLLMGRIKDQLVVEADEDTSFFPFASFFVIRTHQMGTGGGGGGGPHIYDKYQGEVGGKDHGNRLSVHSICLFLICCSGTTGGDFCRCWFSLIFFSFLSLKIFRHAVYRPHSFFISIMTEV